MPKNEFAIGRLRSFVFEFGDDVLAVADAETLLCRCCEVKVDHRRRSSVVQHLKTEKHARAARRPPPHRENRKTGRRDSAFDADLCDAMVSADIPAEKLSDAAFRRFLENYTGRAVPGVSAVLRDRFADGRYARTVDRIRRRTAGRKIWVSVDETCCAAADGDGRPPRSVVVASVVVGTLEEAGAVFLVNAEVLEETEQQQQQQQQQHTAVGKLVDRSLAVLWPDRIRHDDVLLFVSDAAPHAVVCARHLNALYTKTVRVTCVGRALRGACEEIRWRFGAADKIVGNVRQVFGKSPSRLRAFRRHAPGVPPPVDVRPTTGWGSWIEWAVYCCDHFDGVRDVVDALADSGDDAASVRTARENLAEHRGRTDLTYVKTNFGPLLRPVRTLRTAGTPLAESLRAVDDVRARLQAVRHGPGGGAYEKFVNVLNENAGVETLRRISAAMPSAGDPTGVVNGLVPGELAADDLRFYEYAPIAAVDVARSFPGHATFLAGRAESLKSDDTWKQLIIRCNSGLETFKIEL